MPVGITPGVRKWPFPLQFAQSKIPKRVPLPLHMGHVLIASLFTCHVHSTTLEPAFLSQGLFLESIRACTMLVMFGLSWRPFLLCKSLFRRT